MYDFYDTYRLHYNNSSGDDTYEPYYKNSHEYDALQEKIRRTHKTRENLKNSLAEAKERLEMERLQSQTLLCGYHPSLANLKTDYYTNAPYSYSHYDTYQFFYPYDPIYNDPYLKYGKRAFSKTYIDELNEVHRKCNEELNRMQKSISDLRKIKRNWRCQQPKNVYSKSDSYGKTILPTFYTHCEKESTTTESSAYDENTNESQTN